MQVDVRDLVYEYMPGTVYKFTALRGINFSLEKGAFTGIIGCSGSGKSTLMQHFNGSLLPTSGSVLVDGVDVSSSDFFSVKYKVGMLFQYPEHQLFEETVFKDISYGPRNMGLSREEIAKRVYSSIEIVNIPSGYLSRSPFDLSGGERRKIALAGVLAMNPELLVLDEPTASLDSVESQDFLNKIKDLHNSKNLTVVLITHNMEEVVSYCDKVIVLNEGMIKMESSKFELFSDNNLNSLLSCGLDIPDITNLFYKLRERGHDLKKGIFEVESAKREIIKKIKSGFGG